MSVQIVKKTLLTSGNSIKNIRSSIGSFTNSLKSANKTHSRAAVSTTRSNRFLKGLIVKDENYFQRRREAVLRKEREDIIEASRVGGVVKYSGKTAGDSTKGFLGRVMDFFGIVMLGWAVKNLPWMIKGGLGLIKNVTGLVNISQGFVQNTQSTLEEIGRTVQTSQTKLKEYSFDDEKQDMEKEQETINNNLTMMDTDFAITFADIFDNEKNGLSQFSEWLKGDGGTPPKTENLDGTESDNKEGGGFNLGRSSEILRDELKFSKFVGRLRKRFSHLFNDMLRTQLLLKNIITPEDWEVMSEHIQYDFLYDNHFSELKETELFNERMAAATAAEPYVGRYYSQDWVRRKLLRQTDEEILEQDKIMEKEIADGVIPDPMAPVDPETGQPMQDLGAPIMEPDLEKQAQATDSVNIPSGGEI